MEASSVSYLGLMENCLKLWGLEDLLSVFQAHQIDDGIFLSLTSEAMKELIPSIGMRLKFVTNFTQLKEGVVLMKDNNCSNNIEFSITGASSKDSTSCGASGSTTLFSTVDEPEGLISLSSDNRDSTEAQVSPNDSTYDPAQDNESSTESGEASEAGVHQNIQNKKRPLVDKEFVTAKVSILGALKEVHDLDLRSLLESNLEGKAVLNSYKKNKCLEDDDRTAIVDIIVKWLLFRIQDPKKPELVALKEKIMELFPKEENIYYIPPREEGRNQTLARGKLFDKVRNVKDWMRKKGLLAARREKKQKVSRSDAGNGDPVDITEDVDLALKWLKSYREPWPKVEEKWSLTSKYRMYILQHGEGRTVSEYTNTYKVLRQSNGYSLMEIDFHSVHPNISEDALLMSWEHFQKKILQIVTEKAGSIRDPEGRKLIGMVDKCTTDDSKNLLALLCLPSLLVPSRLVQLGRKRIKPTIQESRDAFILNVKVPGDLQPAMVKRRENMAKFGPGATVQPYIAYVGTDCTEVTDIYVIVDLVLYKLESVLRALEVCFKSFTALNAQFPVQAEHLWLLLQRVLYGIVTVHDKSISNVTSFITKLKSMQ